MHKILSEGLNSFEAKDEHGWVHGIPCGVGGTLLDPGVCAGHPQSF